MTKAQKALVEVRAEKSRNMQRRAELSLAAELTDENRAELDQLENAIPDLERRERNLQAVVDHETEAATVETRTDGGDAETRERLELRSRARLGAYVAAFMRGSVISGPEHEFAAAVGCSDGIPLAMFEPIPGTEQRADAASPAPATAGTGTNLQPIHPAIFARSIAPRLGIELPMVPSGTYAEGVITTDLTAGAKAKGADAEATAAAITVQTSNPKRISGRLSIRVEDIAAIGQGNFESALRQNLEMVMSESLDNAVINGTGASNQISGLFKKLSDATAATAEITWDTGWGLFTAGVDGKWASMTSEVGMLVNPEVYRKFAGLFRDIATADLGTISLADYVKQHAGGLWTNARMPDGSSNVNNCIRYRTGQPGVRKACVPVWGNLAIDDIFSGSASGTKFLSMHIVLGDMVLNYADAYEEISVKTVA